MFLERDLLPIRCIRIMSSEHVSSQMTQSQDEISSERVSWQITQSQDMSSEHAMVCVWWYKSLCWLASIHPQGARYSHWTVISHQLITHYLPCTHVWLIYLFVMLKFSDHTLSALHTCVTDGPGCSAEINWSHIIWLAHVWLIDLLVMLKSPCSSTGGAVPSLFAVSHRTVMPYALSLHMPQPRIFPSLTSLSIARHCSSLEACTKAQDVNIIDTCSNHESFRPSPVFPSQGTAPHWRPAQSVNIIDACSNHVSVYLWLVDPWQSNDFVGFLNVWNFVKTNERLNVKNSAQTEECLNVKNSAHAIECSSA